MMNKHMAKQEGGDYRTFWRKLQKQTKDINKNV